jgi:hypothetical protein
VISLQLSALARTIVPFALAGAFALGCSSSEEEPFAVETGEEEEVRESVAGPVHRAGAEGEVWSVTNAWADKSTKAAQAAGVSWPASSGLTWEEKYQRWIASFREVPRTDGQGTTIAIPTPYGKGEIEGPTLECAEVALMLRVTFSSWYHLPFYLEGWDASRKAKLYAGHFGFIDAQGNRLSNFPRFKTAYPDHEPGWKAGNAWPSDPKLRALRLADDDGVAFLGGAGAGAYFDELFLNKRVGHFTRLLLLYFGSINLADGRNMFHVKAEATGAGDVLLERWQSKGIGHTIPVLRVESPAPELLSITVASGSMPRRPPVWEDPSSAHRYFSLPYTGGEGTSNEGIPYAKLGGGIRRWRTPILKAGRWSNDVPAASRPAFLEDTNLKAIAARPARFSEILAVGDPEERKAAALQIINDARAHLRKYPASCSARTKREDGFNLLYRVYEEAFYTGRDQVDEQFRKLEDYVFAELDYSKSKTCCWNSTTSAMADIVLDLAAAEQDAAQKAGACAAPTVFRAMPGGDGYNLWREHAKKLGREADWKPWSEDEPCSQKSVTEDTLKSSLALPWCALLPPSRAGSAAALGGLLRRGLRRPCSLDLPGRGLPRGRIRRRGSLRRGPGRGGGLRGAPPDGSLLLREEFLHQLRVVGEHLLGLLAGLAPVVPLRSVVALVAREPLGVLLRADLVLAERLVGHDDRAHALQVGDAIEQGGLRGEAGLAGGAQRVLVLAAGAEVAGPHLPQPVVLVVPGDPRRVPARLEVHDGHRQQRIDARLLCHAVERVGVAQRLGFGNLGPRELHRGQEHGNGTNHGPEGDPARRVRQISCRCRRARD